MGYYASDVYYQPEAFGLTPELEVELSEPDYSFDILMVWRDEDSELWYATDSGCSCPSPFEDYTSKDKLTKFDLDEVVAIIKERTIGREEVIVRPDGSEYIYTNTYGMQPAYADEVIQKLERLARGE